MSDIHGAVGSYVVHALEPDEAREFEAHLETCPTCRDEVAEFGETVAELSLLVPAGPPAGLRSSVLSAIKEVRPLPPEEESVASGVARPRMEPSTNGVSRPGLEPYTNGVARADAEHWSWWDEAAVGQASVTVPLDELASLRRSRGRARVLVAAVAAVLVAALGLGTWAVTLLRNQEAQVVTQQVETELLKAPDVRVFRTELSNGAQVSVYVSERLNRAMFVGGDLPSPGPDRVYQLWTLEDGQPVPDDVVDPGTQREFFQNSIARAAGVAVSIEPLGGSRTTPTDVLGQVPFVSTS